MNIQKVTKEYRLSKWMQVIQERQNSGQSIKVFCQEKGISRHAYFYWQRKLRKDACMELTKQTRETIVSCAPQGWMQLPQNQEIKSTLDIEVGGCRVSVDAETDTELLKKICRILRIL
ncbi:IS66 family insertion sequence element accessory protein TnpA [Phosphitispora fastidiosa]|uniref:IS66 family insertion sequence element accessory protein TnpA n=1 Tax=Phosphitispora fastidiosa TaxID=2837202 RepID=UPI001E403A3F|nr:IS66 family insertion sequence element accessory protein TnpB [Phosphitispora fastidiosa]MBU7008872.1 transposase-like protein [Phosphitispora fastidiosa]